MKYGISFRCFYGKPEDSTTHYREMELADGPRWIDAYQFTHPNVQSITVKVWFMGKGEQE